MYRFQLDTTNHGTPGMLWVDVTVLTVPEDEGSFPQIVLELPLPIVGPDAGDDASKQLRDVLVAAAELL